MSETNRPSTAGGGVLAARTTDEIIAAMEQEDQAAERERLLRTMNPACREKFEYLEGWLRREVSHTLRSRYELGLQVKELYEDERRGGSVYGRNAVGRICRLLDWDDGVIRAALRFVQAFTPDDLDRLCGRVLPTGEPLTWSHVRTLLAVDSPAKRQELLDRAAEEGWTCTDLAREVRAIGDPRPQDGRGRPPRTPNDFDGAAAQQRQSAEQWDRMFSKVWGRQDRSLVTQAAKLPAGEVTEGRLRQAPSWPGSSAGWRTRRLNRPSRRRRWPATSSASWPSDGPRSRNARPGDGPGRHLIWHGARTNCAPRTPRGVPAASPTANSFR